MIRVEAYRTKRRYASDMMTEGVIVLRAAVMKLKVACIADGRTDRAWRSVV